MQSQPIAGVINLYKPVGRSSAQYVYRLRPILGLRKVGHAGTLDPFADGVVLACVGAGTKLVERLMALPKTYRVQMRLGVTNKTYDTEQAFEPVAGAVPVTGEAVSAAIATFVGEVQQVPPAFSAIKIDGVPGYEYAKRGKATVRAAKLVRIDRIAVESYTWPILTAEIHCGRGTYIRAIARDLGRLLGCGAVCETLTRTAVGPFRIEDSVDLTRATDDQVRAAIRSINETVGLLGE